RVRCAPVGRAHFHLPIVPKRRCSSKEAQCRKAVWPLPIRTYDNSEWAVGPSSLRVKETRVEHACLFYSFRVKIQTRLRVEASTGEKRITGTSQLVVILALLTTNHHRY